MNTEENTVIDVEVEQTEKGLLYFDNTRVAGFMECPRQYYFRHIRHWRKPSKSTALAFGSGWHAGLDAIWSGAGDKELTNEHLVDRAARAFEQEWEKAGFSLDTIDLNEKRSPGLALDMFDAYVEKYRHQIAKYNVLAVEQPFIVPVLEDQDIYYIGRWDKVYEDRGRVYIREHKTTSLYRKEGNFDSNWISSFSPNNQVDGYSYAGLGVYGDRFDGVMVEGALVHKTVRAFTVIPLKRAYQNLEAWLFELRYYIDEILDNMTMLKESGDQADYMMCFPKRTTQCSGKYGLCEYINICKYGDANPARMPCPADMEENEWNPFDHNTGDGKTPAIIGSGDAR